ARRFAGWFGLGGRVGGGVERREVVSVKDVAGAAEGRIELAVEPSFLLRAGEPLLALGGVLIGVAPRDVEDVGENFRRLSHIELDDGIGEAALEPDDRLEEGRTKSP